MIRKRQYTFQRNANKVYLGGGGREPHWGKSKLLIKICVLSNVKHRPEVKEGPDLFSKPGIYTFINQ